MKYNKGLNLMIICGSILLSSCDKNDNYADVYNKDVEIETFKGNINFDISERDKWSLTIDDNPYYYNYTGDILLSIPYNKPFVLEKSRISALGFVKNSSPLVIRYTHPNYYKSDTPTYPQSPAINDQSTLEKMMVADMLYCEYTGKALNNLTGELTHANAMIDFDILEHPEKSEFFVSGPLYITPYYSYGRYKAIVPAYGDNNSAIIIMKAGNSDKPYIAQLCGNDNNNFVKPNTIYRFSVRYNSLEDKIEILNIKESVWSNEK